MIKIESNENKIEVSLTGMTRDILADLCSAVDISAEAIATASKNEKLQLISEMISTLCEANKIMPTNINVFAADVHRTAVAHGWWEKPQEVPEMIALCHSELSEALEEWRKGMPALYGTCALHKEDCFAYREGDCPGDCEPGNCKPEGIAAELADCVLRIFDFCAGNDIDLEGILKAKNEYNKHREYKHGGKKI